MVSGRVAKRRPSIDALAKAGWNLPEMCRKLGFNRQHIWAYLQRSGSLEAWHAAQQRQKEDEAAERKAEDKRVRRTRNDILCRKAIDDIVQRHGKSCKDDEVQRYVLRYFEHDGTRKSPDNLSDVESVFLVLREYLTLGEDATYHKIDAKLGKKNLARPVLRKLGFVSLRKRAANSTIVPPQEHLEAIARAPIPTAEVPYFYEGLTYPGLLYHLKRAKLPTRPRSFLLYVRDGFSVDYRKASLIMEYLDGRPLRLPKQSGRLLCDYVCKQRSAIEPPIIELLQLRYPEFSITKGYHPERIGVWMPIENSA